MVVSVCVCLNVYLCTEEKWSHYVDQFPNITHTHSHTQRESARVCVKWTKWVLLSTVSVPLAPSPPSSVSGSFRMQQVWLRPLSGCLRRLPCISTGALGSGVQPRLQLSDRKAEMKESPTLTGKSDLKKQQEKRRDEQQARPEVNSLTVPLASFVTQRRSYPERVRVYFWCLTGNKETLNRSQVTAWSLFHWASFPDSRRCS